MRLNRSSYVLIAIIAIVALAPVHTGAGSTPQSSTSPATPPNEAPRLLFIPSQAVATDFQSGTLLLSAGTTLRVTVVAVDANPQDTLTLTAFFGIDGHLPGSAHFTQISNTTGVFEWTPQPVDEGVWGPDAGIGRPPLTVRVRDNGVPQLEHSQNVVISVGPSANMSPRLDVFRTGTQTSLAAPVIGREGESLQFDLECRDGNAVDLLTVAASGATPLPAGATLARMSIGRENPVKYAFAWNVQTGQAGTDSVEFLCQDNASPALSEGRLVTFEIAAPTSPPRILAVVPDQGPAEGGSIITIVGINVGGTTDVLFGNAPVPVTVIDGTTITATTIAGVTGGLADVSVTTPFGTATREGAFLYHANPDADGNGIPDCVEGAADADADGVLNLNDPDDDGDGIPDAAEFLGLPSRPTVPLVCAGVTWNAADSDGDGEPDFLDLDSDNDGIADRIEGESDLDADGIPNYRDLDSDGDTVPETSDNCRSAPNSSQADADGDGVGDVCDDDADNDGLVNILENVYGTGLVTMDSDSDSLSDGEEVFAWATDPLVADSDGGGVLDGLEAARGTDPLDPADDDAAPVISIAAPTTVEATGPSGAPVPYFASAFDEVDGGVDVTCTPLANSIFPLGDTTVTCEAQDSAGHVGRAEFTVRVVDTTPPAISAPRSVALEATGPLGAPLIVEVSAMDLVDGAVSVICAPALGSMLALGSHTATCTAADAAGNRASSVRFTVNVADTTAPVLSCPANITVEAASAAGTTVAFSAAAAADLVTAAPHITYSHMSGAAFPLGQTVVTVTATDLAANSSSCTFSIAVLDTVAPAVAILAPQATVYTPGQVVMADYACSDAVTGIASCSGPVAIGSPIDTATPGPKIFTVTASDHAGNVTTQSVSYTVLGQTACLLYDPARAVRAGGTIPIRFQLCNAAGENLSSADTTVTAIEVVKIANTTSSDVIDAGDANPDANFRFDPSLGGTGGYIFNLKTVGLSTGTYVVVYQAGADPTHHASELVFRVK